LPPHSKELIDPQLLKISPEVQAALVSHKPVVALESTVIAHGLPRPQNLITAKELETIVRDVAAAPATIAILKGRLSVGLEQHELDQIASRNDIQKISIRDLPVAVANEVDGATTVASTIWIADRAGISIFATGGIGGVHRSSLPDISADLPQLAKTPIIVVCSGAKIVLDLPATREWLETHGVTVVGYQCDEMPAFYSRQSGLGVDVVANSSDDVIRIFDAQRRLEIDSSLLVTVPVPAEAEVPAADLRRILNEALAQAELNGIAGRELTPFLLSRMAQQSDGATLKANIALLKNNVRIAAEIAVRLHNAI
jgi:pseudouridine-5'-phosphate glycosidase